MGALAWILGAFGGLCAVMGIITATEVVPLFGAALTVEFWLTVSIVLFLACIASALAARREYE